MNAVNEDDLYQAVMDAARAIRSDPRTDRLPVGSQTRKDVIAIHVDAAATAWNVPGDALRQALANSLGTPAPERASDPYRR